MELLILFVEEITLDLYASMDGYSALSTTITELDVVESWPASSRYSDFYGVFSKISFVKSWLEERGLTEHGYKFGWASYNWNNKLAKIGMKFPADIMNVRITVEVQKPVYLNSGLFLTFVCIAWAQSCRVKL